MLGKTIHSLSDDLREWMTHYSWPGNIRELSNVIEYAVNIEDGATLSVDSLPPRFESPAETFQMCNKDKQRMESLRGILQDQGWGKSGKIAAAKAFGVSLATIYRWVEAFDLKRPRR
jgi:transcriptional regulator of acetoin/glycerol metabolism